MISNSWIRCYFSPVRPMNDAEKLNWIFKFLDEKSKYQRVQTMLFEKDIGISTVINFIRCIEDNFLYMWFKKMKCYLKLTINCLSKRMYMLIYACLIKYNEKVPQKNTLLSLINTQMHAKKCLHVDN